jgi:hypothetical protein
LVQFPGCGGHLTTAQLQAGCGEGTGIPVESSSGDTVTSCGSLTKGISEKLPHSRGYRLLANGYRPFLLFLKLFDRIHTPFVAKVLRLYRGDRLVSNGCINLIICTDLLLLPKSIGRGRRSKGGRLIQSLRTKFSLGTDNALSAKFKTIITASIEARHRTGL